MMNDGDGDGDGDDLDAHASQCIGITCIFVGVHEVVLHVFFHFDSKGAKEYKSCSSRKMLKNAPSLAIGGVDIAENEPSKVPGPGCARVPHPG